jgi:hypothetical protein
MRSINILIFLITIFSFSCENNETDLIIDSTEGFCIKIGDSIFFNHNQIDFYDFSSHLIYLKNGNSFLYATKGIFTVFADNIEIYSGQMFPSYSSYLPIGPVIYCAPSFYNDYIIPIGFIQVCNTLGNKNADPRKDMRIIEALNKYNQYREGLKCEIIAVQNITFKNVKIELRLTNNDFNNLYYLDPNKMGINLFHYFTNGLFLRDSTNKTYTHSVSITHPDPWDAWKIEWLSILKSKESKTLSIIYENFETITPGQYNAFFSFPGLKHQVARDEFRKDNGRIWLGDLHVTKKIIIE